MTDVEHLGRSNVFEFQPDYYPDLDKVFDERAALGRERALERNRSHIVTRGANIRKGAK